MIEHDGNAGNRSVGRTRRGLLTLGLAVSLMVAGPAAAQASASSGAARTAAGTISCGQWHPKTLERFTSNHMLGIYLQEQQCVNSMNNDYYFYYKVAVHNYSDNGVGNRAYALYMCDSYRMALWGGVYIPPGGAWASPEQYASHFQVYGVIYRPRTSTTDDYVVEVSTPCV